MSSKQLRIVIAGAGLGGLTAAVRFARDGHDVEVLERSSALSTASGAIYIRSNAVRSFYRWGLREGFESVATHIQNYQFRNGFNNDELSRVKPQFFSEYPELATDRGALQNFLFNVATEAGARVSFGKEVSELTEDDSHAYITCKDGTKITADLLLAADGISSRLRPAVLSHCEPEAPAPIPAPSTHYPAELPLDSLLANDVTKFMVNEPDSRDSVLFACQGGYIVGNYNHARRLFNIMFSIQHKDADNSNPRLFDEVGDPKIVQDFFAPCHPILGALAGMTKECSRWRLARLEPLKRWSSARRRLVLLGDSAHAMLPNLAQGFSSIVEDVDALSVFLESGREMSDLIELWEKTRMPRTAQLQNGSLDNYKLLNKGMAPGDELTEEQKSLPMGDGDGNAPFNSLPWLKWNLNYDAAEEVSQLMIAS